MEQLIGADIYHGTKVDWTKFNPDFLSVKCTQGNTFFDPMYIENITQARKKNIPLIHMHFARNQGATADINPDIEADFFLAHCDLKTGDCIALDAETGQTDTWKETFMHYVSGKTGIQVDCIFIYPVLGIDLGQLWACRYWVNDGQNHLAQYPPNLGGFKIFTIGQYTSKGTIKGITGNADLDVFYGTKDQLKKLGKSPTIPVVSETTQIPVETTQPAIETPLASIPATSEPPVADNTSSTSSIPITIVQDTTAAGPTSGTYTMQSTQNYAQSTQNYANLTSKILQWLKSWFL